jgi:hypothetical protein
MIVSRTITCVVRVAQTVLAVVIIALVGRMISTSGWNMIPKQGGNAAEVNFAMFLGVWTLLTMFAFIPAALWPPEDENYFIPIAALDGLTAVFYMSGAIALAAALNIHNCRCSDS